MARWLNARARLWTISSMVGDSDEAHHRINRYALKLQTLKERFEGTHSAAA